MTLADRGDRQGQDFANSICEQIRDLEHEAQLFEIARKLPEFKDWEPV